MTKLVPTLALLLATVGCTKSDLDDTDNPISEADADADADADSDTDSDADTDAPFVFEPAAVGVYLEAGYDSDDEELTWYSFESDTDTSYDPFMYLTVPDIEWFSLSSDDPSRADHECKIYATFPHVIEAFPAGYGFDYTAGKGGNGETYNLFFFAEGMADIYSYDALLDDFGELILDADGNAQASEPCQALIDSGVMAQLAGMHLGLGMGELSTYLTEEYWDNFDGDLAELEGTVAGGYIAMNHPDGAGGYDFKAYDWGNAFFFEGTLDEGTYVEDSEGNEIEVDLVTATVDAEESTLVRTNAGDTALIRFNTYWYEDFPNLDLDMMQEGVPDDL
jgi:hypothetical protein